MSEEYEGMPYVWSVVCSTPDYDCLPWDIRVQILDSLLELGWITDISGMPFSSVEDASSEAHERLLNAYTRFRIRMMRMNDEHFRMEI